MHRRIKKFNARTYLRCELVNLWVSYILPGGLRHDDQAEAETCFFSCVSGFIFEESDTQEEIIFEEENWKVAKSLESLIREVRRRCN